MNTLARATECFFKGLQALESQDLSVAEAHFQEALALAPGRPSVLVNLSIVHTQQGRLQDALHLAEMAVRQDDGEPLFWLQKGVVELGLGRPEEALASFAHAIERDPSLAEAHHNSGSALNDLRRFEEAVVSFRAAIELKPGNAEALNALGNALKHLDRLDEALSSYGRAIELRPGFAEAYNNRGRVLKALDRTDEAIADFDKAVGLKPDYVEAIVNRAYALKDASRLDEAIVGFGRALSLKPGLEHLPGERIAAKMKICDWQDLDADLKAIRDEALSGRLVMAPFTALTVYDDPALHLAMARTYADANFPPIPGPAILPQARAHAKIRVGYYTSDFRNHPGASLMAELFEEHDRGRFEFYAFSFTRRTNDPLQMRISDAFSHFIDINETSDEDVVKLSRKLEIDIAVNRNGYTRYSRSNIFAGRSAPLQVNYLGYPGTTGASYMDYIVADDVIIPEENRRHYSEKIVYLPGSYQVNDSKRMISPRVFTRADMGLPDDTFVFCCFNNTHKIMPRTFESWMRILREVDRSVLWLYEKNQFAAARLRTEAASRGVDPDRIVFAAKLPREEHLARHRLADLFLDTLPYNAHTTASDALWAGLPVLTCIGQSFAARVAASLLTALDLRELIVDDLGSYEELAMSLARNPRRLSGLRDKLQRNRTTSSLFDGRAFARNIEAAYVAMYERFMRGLPPDDIRIAGGLPPN